VEETAAALRELGRALPDGWDAARQKLPIPFPKLNSLRDSPDAELSEHIKVRRNACRRAAEKLRQFFAADSAALIADLRAMAPAMTCLLELALDFQRSFAQEKRRAECLDFSDLEHLALQLLVDGNGAPTALAESLAGRYTEIMVDEYQDVNAVQDALFHAVSRQGKNLFMVGDVKQSIYRFRLADPGIFLEKYRLFRHFEAAEGDEPRKILLRENFRSRRSVLDAANHVFKNIMSTDLGELDYDEEAALQCGAAWYPPEGEQCAEMHVLTLPEDEDAPDKELIEARYVAKQIRALVDRGTPIFDGGETRPMRWGDVAILLRSPGSAGGAYAAALAEADIPVGESGGASFFSAPEIAAMVSLLAVIDNPHQDVPLISALRSPFFGFGPDELAAIRASGSGGSFFDALARRAGDDPKCAAFLEKLDALRAVAADLPTDALLRRIYNALDAMAVVSAMPEGEGRKRNLLLLLDYAGQFEAEGFRGLFKFVASLRRRMERGEDPPMPAAGGDSVSILSIHKAKGLEFPVVFLCDTARRFNKQDISETVLIHASLGLGPKLTDADRGLEYPTLARRAIAAKMEQELLSEEMRVLYEALTRAKERLYITCALPDAESTLEKLRPGVRSPIPPQELEGAASPAQWLLQAALLPQDCLRLIQAGEEAAPEAQPEPERARPAADGDTVEKLCRRLDFVYPYAASVELPSKLTATELKGADETDPESASLLPVRRESVFRLPELGVERPLTGAEKGTATHLVMQYIDFSKTSTPEEIGAEIARLTRAGVLTDRQAAGVDQKAVLGFFRSELGQRVLRADKVLRELPFSLLWDAADFGGAPGDRVLLQGVIDCCITEGDKLTIIDYKTDYVNQETITDRVKYYAGQVRAYAAAMERITGRRVRGTALYFLRAGQAVFLDEKGEIS
jgi:ATP-dependent helicase/nuclease subunit A